METKVQRTPPELTLLKYEVRPYDGLCILATCSGGVTLCCRKMNDRPAASSYFPLPSGCSGYLTLPSPFRVFFRPVRFGLAPGTPLVSLCTAATR